MAFKKSFSALQSASNYVSFAKKYSLREAAGVKEAYDEAFVLPLDIKNGLTCLPVHAVKAQVYKEKGFKSIFDTKIICHRFDKTTGEPSDELPLCCRLAKEESKNSKDYTNRIVGPLSNRIIIPLLVFSTVEESIKKKPSLKKLSIKGVSFSYADLASSTFQSDVISQIKGDLETRGEIESASSTDEDTLDKAMKHLSQTIFKVTNTPKDRINIKSYKAVPIDTPIIGELSGEGDLIRLTVKFLSGEIPPEKYEALYAKFPVIKEINNQVVDYLQLFNDNVDTIVTEWNDDELQEYYDSFIERKNQLSKYVQVSEELDANEEIVTMNTTIPQNGMYQQMPAQQYQPQQYQQMPAQQYQPQQYQQMPAQQFQAQPIQQPQQYQQMPAQQYQQQMPVQQAQVPVQPMAIDMSEFLADEPAAPAPVQQAQAPVQPQAPAQTEQNFDYSSVSLDTNKSPDLVDFSEDEFELDESDFDDIESNFGE